jgi:hypothetical protein
VRFQGRPYTVAGLGWEHVTLLDDSLAPVAVLRGLLLCDPTFEVLGHQVASSGTVEPLAQLGLVDEAELERVQELERHLLEVSAPSLPARRGLTTTGHCRSGHAAGGRLSPSPPSGQASPPPC